MCPITRYSGARNDCRPPNDRVVLNGCRTAGFHYSYIDPGEPAMVHTHPVSDEAVVVWEGSMTAQIGDHHVRMGTYDVVLAPCGVPHGGGPAAEDGRVWMGGFASPPQLDLYLRTDYYRNGQFSQPPFVTLSP